ncbi:sarcosine oxidase subunit gamma [Gemmobacter denitrificans]|uniref:Sarcosine oxidase subunit gamma n=1 Tax=Gemmobacter denitrificans TaxID=3123040 RepID=A0ABU8BZN8_9RHOB
MPKLIAKSPLSDIWPVTHGALSLSELVLDRVVSVAPFPGQAGAMAKALKPLGLAFPEPNRMHINGEMRIVWTGRDQAFLFNAALDTPAAALTDQSAGWACLRLEGEGAAEALMRLYPIDLRAAAFPHGHAIRAPLNHMNSILMRLEDAFEIMVFRSMARTAWAEIEHAMLHLAARAQM